MIHNDSSSFPRCMLKRNGYSGIVGETCAKYVHFMEREIHPFYEAELDIAKEWHVIIVCTWKIPLPVDFV